MKRNLRVRIAACLALASTGVWATPSAASAIAVVPPTLTYFNNPLTSDTPGAPSTITQAIRSFLMRAYDESTVRIAIARLDNSVLLADSTGAVPQNENYGPIGTDVAMIVEAIVAANNAGATIEILMHGGPNDDPGTTLKEQSMYAPDPDQPTTKYSKLSRYLNGLPNVVVKWCERGCFGGNEPGGHVMHNKFMIADKLLAEPRANKEQDMTQAQLVTVSNNVLQMTANWTNAHLSSRYWNSAVEFHNAQLYAGYDTYWTNMNGCATNGSHHCASTYPGTNLGRRQRRARVYLPSTQRRPDLRQNL